MKRRGGGRGKEVARVDGGRFIGAPSRGRGRPTSNYAFHQGLWFPNVDYGLRFMIRIEINSISFLV
jgi:hypothetical protein